MNRGKDDRITFIFDYKFSLHETIVDLVKSNELTGLLGKFSTGSGK